MRFSKFCVLSSTLAVLGLATNVASAVEVKVTTPTIVPKVTVNPQTPQPRAIGGQSNGAGAGKETFNTFSNTKNVGTTSPSLFKDATTGKTIGVKTEIVGAGTIGSNVSPSTSAGNGPENPLYRVQIHHGSAGGFNWSRD